MAKQHTTEFLAEMKTRLTEEKNQLDDELNTTTTFPDYGRNEEDNATEIADYQATAATQNTLKQRLNSIIDALERIETGNYGITDEGETIPEDRLRANPAATTTIKPS